MVGLHYYYIHVMDANIMAGHGKDNDRFLRRYLSETNANDMLELFYIPTPATYLLYCSDRFPI
jgi:hypothetical protein